MKEMEYNGILLRIGDRFRECDNRFERFVIITDFDFLNKRVRLNGRTWASARRFNGKHGGYAKVECAAV